MKVVLDTNVFVSGIFFSGPPYQILEAWRNGIIQLIISPEILDEYRRVGEVLADQHPGVDLLPVLEYVIHHAEIYAAAALSETVSEDPDDDIFLACAIASQCTLIVSGDKHLLRVSGYRGIDVLKPREFTNRYLE